MLFLKDILRPECRSSNLTQSEICDQSNDGINDNTDANTETQFSVSSHESQFVLTSSQASSPVSTVHEAPSTSRESSVTNKKC